MKILPLSLLLIVPAIEALGLSPTEQREIGLKIWRNEGGQKYEHLAFWNKNEPFPSFGIGHFIWYPAGTLAHYDQTFPDLCDYLSAHNIVLPDWLSKARSMGAPWQTKEAFDKSPLIKEVRNLLAATIDLQAGFCIERLEKVWPSIRTQSDRAKRTQIDRHFNELIKTARGSYALIDYLNFKGAGTNPQEQYNGHGWGLLQVLEAIPKNTTPDALIDAFADAAQKILKQRIANAPTNKKSHEESWLAGWLNRINSYRT